MPSVAGSSAAGHTVKPNFLVIGAARSGTTALMQFVSRHPQVFVTTPKEPHFFAFANTTPRFSGPGDDEMINRAIVADPAAYANLYGRAGDAVARGDGSVSSLYYPEAAMDNIERYADPTVKLIVLLREPVERAFSSYLYLRSRGNEPIDTFRAALAAENERRTAGWHHMWHYSNMGLYGQQLMPFVERFGRDRLLVVSHRDLNTNPDQVLARVFQFIGVPAMSVDTAAEINRSGEPKSKLVHRAQMLIRRNERVKQAVRAIVPYSLRESVRAANLNRPVLDAEVKAELAAFYEQDRMLLEEAGLSCPW